MDICSTQLSQDALSVDLGAGWKLFFHHFLCFTSIEIEILRSRVTEFSRGRCGTRVKVRRVTLKGQNYAWLSF